MGLGEQGSKYRFRTIWTPEMDRYFIDLMLEQVGKEHSRVDNLFSQSAWKHMVVMFNAKFDSKYEQDVLKNRHKMLRNLYRAIKNLLEQKGFRWDESRQMVTADNEVWDDYIQTHPDARSYRVKTIPYYTDLIRIYEIMGSGGVCKTSRPNANFDENISKADRSSLLEAAKDDEKLNSNVLEYSPNTSDNMNCKSQLATDSLRDITIDEDYGSSVSKDMVDDTHQFQSDFGSPIGARMRTCWEPPMDRYFVSLTLDQVSKGNHSNGLLRIQAWREMILLFNAKFGSDYGVDVLKNRYKTLRRQHNLIKGLLELDGFAWDDARQMVIAEDHVWQNYIKTHTDARQYMTRPIPCFKDLCLIFRQLNSDDSKFVTVNQSPSVSSYDQPHKETGSSDSDSNTKATKRGLDTPPTMESLKKPKREMATAVSSLAVKRKEDENVSGVRVELVVRAIQDLPDMDEELVLDACDLLEDETKAKMFLALDVKLRRKWLIRKLRPLQQRGKIVKLVL